MSTTNQQIGNVDMRLEVITLPVSDVDRSIDFSRASAGGWMPTFADPDGNEFLLQEITQRLPGRVWND